MMIRKLVNWSCRVLGFVPAIIVVSACTNLPFLSTPTPIPLTLPSGGSLLIETEAGIIYEIVIGPDAATIDRREIFRPEVSYGQIWESAISPDQNYLLISYLSQNMSTTTLLLIDLETSQATKIDEGQTSTLEGRKGGIRCLDWSPDSKQLSYYESYAAKLVAYSLETHEPRTIYQPGSANYSITEGGIGLGPTSVVGEFSCNKPWVAPDTLLFTTYLGEMPKSCAATCGVLVAANTVVLLDLNSEQAYKTRTFRDEQGITMRLKVIDICTVGSQTHLLLEWFGGYYVVDLVPNLEDLKLRKLPDTAHARFIPFSCDIYLNNLDISDDDSDKWVSTLTMIDTNTLETWSEYRLTYLDLAIGDRAGFIDPKSIFWVGVPEDHMFIYDVHSTLHGPYLVDLDKAQATALDLEFDNYRVIGWRVER